MEAASQRPKASSWHSGQVMHLDLAFSPRTKNVPGGIKHLDAHNSPIRRIVDRHIFGQSVRSDLDRFIEKANVQRIHLRVIANLHRVQSPRFFPLFQNATIQSVTDTEACNVS